MSHVEFLTPDEQKIRKRWLFWYVKLPTALLSVVWISLMLVLAYAWSQNSRPSGVDKMFFLIFLIGGGTIAAAYTYMYYYCAYKTPGYILLTLDLIFKTMSIPANLYEFYVRINETNQPQYRILWCLAMLIVIVSYVWCFYLSYRLRKINKRVSVQVLLNTEKYQQTVSLFEHAINLEELEAKFINLISSTENGRDRDLIATAYKARQAELAT